MTDHIGVVPGAQEAAHREAIREVLAAHSRGLDRHEAGLLGQTFFALDGTQARTETYVYARHLLHGGAEELAFAGRYLDQLELRDQQWKILHRQVVMDWSLRLAVQDERNGDAFGALSKGRSDRDDPAHHLLPID